MAVWPIESVDFIPFPQDLLEARNVHMKVQSVATCMEFGGRSTGFMKVELGGDTRKFFCVHMTGLPAVVVTSL